GKLVDVTHTGVASYQLPVVSRKPRLSSQTTGNWQLLSHSPFLDLALQGGQFHSQRLSGLLQVAAGLAQRRFDFILYLPVLDNSVERALADSQALGSLLAVAGH